VGLVLAVLGGLVGLALLLGGLAMLAIAVFGNEEDGFYTSDTERLETDSYAITAEDIDLEADPIGRIPEEWLGTVRITFEAADGESVFAGIGTESEVDAYLSGVGHDRITDFDDTISYEETPGGAPRRPPGREDLWVTQVEGVGEQSLEWDAEGGVWSVVMMNSDAARGVAVDADAGVEFEWLLRGGLILTGLGLLVLVLSVIAGRAAIPPASPDRD
jgi:hypothetical protein